MMFKKLLDFKTLHTPRPYVNALVRFHHEFSDEDRYQAALRAGWNVFQFPSEMLLGGDLLSDSGTTTLTSEQFAKMMLGDEAYGTNYGYPLLIDRMKKILGVKTDTHELYLFHQARPAEHALFSQLKRYVFTGTIPSNGHFDTTGANIEANRLEALNFFSEDLVVSENAPFAGNMNISALHELLSGKKMYVPLVYLTVTNNTGGGQPVSMENMKAVRALCDEHRVPLFLDACRFAENAWFIKQREEGYGEKQITEIVREMFSLCDGFTISFKKDGLSNIGGALVVRKESALTARYPDLLENLRDHQILTEGHPTYGGMTGQNIMAIAEGLAMVVREPYLAHRIGLVREFGEYMNSRGIPVLRPFGGHAVYINIDRFFLGTKMIRKDFGGIALTGLLLLKGVRLCELGAFAFGKYDPKTGKESFPRYNFVRAAVPRNKYEIADLRYVGDCVKELYERRCEIPRAIPVYGRKLTLRHFKARFELEKL